MEEDRNKASKRWALLPVLVAIVILICGILIRFIKVRSADREALTFEGDVFNAGTVTDSGYVVHSFRFRNTGAVPAVLDKIKTSCACTAAASSQRTILPKESGEIEVKMKLGVLGVNAHTIVISINGGHWTKVLKLQAKYEPVAIVRAVPPLLDLRSSGTADFSVIVLSAKPGAPEVATIKARRGAITIKDLSTKRPFVRGVKGFHETEFRFEALKGAGELNQDDVLEINFVPSSFGPLLIPIRLSPGRATEAAKEVLFVTDGSATSIPRQVVELESISPNAMVFDVKSSFSDWLRVTTEPSRPGRGLLISLDAFGTPPKRCFGGAITVVVDENGEKTVVPVNITVRHIGKG